MPHPEPEHGVFVFHGKCSVMQTDPGGPEPPNLLEVQGRMLRVAPQWSIGSVGEEAYVFRKLAAATPELGLARCLTAQCNVPLADPPGLRPLARPAAPKRRRPRSAGPMPQRRIRQTTPEMRRVRRRGASGQPPRSRLRCSSTTVYPARLRMHNGARARRG